MRRLELSAFLLVLLVPRAALADRILNLTGSPLEPVLMLGGQEQLLLSSNARGNVVFTSAPPGAVTLSKPPNENWRMEGVAVGTTELQAYVDGVLVATAPVEVREIDALAVRTWSAFDDVGTELHIVEGGSVGVLVDAEAGGDALTGYGPQFALIADGNFYPTKYGFSLQFEVGAGLTRGTYPLSLRTQQGVYQGLTIHVHGVDEVMHAFDDVGGRKYRTITIRLHLADGTRVFGARTALGSSGDFGDIAVTSGGDGYSYTTGRRANETEVYFIVGDQTVSTTIDGTLDTIEEGRSCAVSTALGGFPRSRTPMWAPWMLAACMWMLRKRFSRKQPSRRFR